MNPSMSMPRPTDDAKEAFRALVPADAAVTTKPMFGNLAAFVNGNMFAGLFGDDLFVRVGDADRATLLAKGGRDFEPVPGRRMTGYVMLAPGWRKRTAEARTWIGTALTATRTLPAKGPKPPRAKKST
jgi:TfoX/Sxy family transcriptional regulator of competence genes